MSKVNIILVHGKTHSGKGVFSEILERTLKEKNKGNNIVRCSLSTYVRKLVDDFYYNGDMDSPEAREFMAKVYEYGTKLYPYHKSRRVWEKDILPYLNTYKNNIVIVESFREKNDIKYFEILQEQGFIDKILTIKIERPNYEMKNYINAKHKSENDLNDYKFDYTILNNGTLEQLENTIRKFICTIDEDVFYSDDVPKLSVGDKVKVINVNNDNLEHVTKFVEMEGYILSWYPTNDGRLKYFVDFGVGSLINKGIEPCSFYRNELETVINK